MYLNFEYNEYKYHLKFDGLLNVIFDKSSTGKTTLSTKLLRHTDAIKTDAYSVILNPNIEMVRLLTTSTSFTYLIVMDSDNYVCSDIFDYISKLKDNHITFLILGRRYINRLPLAIQNTYTFERWNGVTRNVRLIENNEFYHINLFKKVVTEDSKSSYLFFKDIFKNIDSAGSNSNITKSLDINSVVIFDGLGFGAYLEKFLDAIEKEPRYSYVCWHSFEYFILESVFGEHGIPKELNLEEAVANRLREVKVDYSKSIGCTDNACKVCSNMCKQSSKNCLLNSKYAELYNKYVENNPFMSAINKM